MSPMGDSSGEPAAAAPAEAEAGSSVDILLPSVFSRRKYTDVACLVPLVFVLVAYAAMLGLGAAQGRRVLGRYRESHDAHDGGGEGSLRVLLPSANTDAAAYIRGPLPAYSSFLGGNRRMSAESAAESALGITESESPSSSSKRIDLPPLYRHRASASCGLRALRTYWFFPLSAGVVAFAVALLSLQVFVRAADSLIWYFSLVLPSGIALLGLAVIIQAFAQGGASSKAAHLLLPSVSPPSAMSLVSRHSLYFV
eukprot:GHVU01201479.1.p2 GENE.GHVU01201479.1~~GHVU01201479.1.p2  ORF type:complete len:254 (-),score=37.02 GHVU01201479.1:912-1673(-)